MIYQGLVVTGTDTEIGKTVIARAMVGLLRESGRRVGVLKPVETGCAGDELVPADGQALMEAAGLEGMKWDQVVPWRLRAPLAPEEAARCEGLEITVDRIYQAMDLWMSRADLVVVETAGGLLVPLNPRFTNADLIQALELPVIVVAPNRLGVINHSLLTLEALARRKVTAAAVILNQVDPGPDRSRESNARYLERDGGVPVYEVPFGEGDPGEAAAAALRPHFGEVLASVERDWSRVRERYVNNPSKEDGAR